MEGKSSARTTSAGREAWVNREAACGRNVGEGEEPGALSLRACRDGTDIRRLKRAAIERRGDISPDRSRAAVESPE